MNLLIENLTFVYKKSFAKSIPKSLKISFDTIQIIILF